MSGQSINVVNKLISSFSAVLIILRQWPIKRYSFSLSSFTYRILFSILVLLLQSAPIKSTAFPVLLRYWISRITQLTTLSFWALTVHRYNQIGIPYLDRWNRWCFACACAFFLLYGHIMTHNAIDWWISHNLSRFSTEYFFNSLILFIHQFRPI